MDCSTKGIIIQGAFSICRCPQVSPKMREILCEALTKSTLCTLCCAWLGSQLLSGIVLLGHQGCRGPRQTLFLAPLCLRVLCIKWNFPPSPRAAGRVSFLCLHEVTSLLGRLWSPCTQGTYRRCVDKGFLVLHPRREDSLAVLLSNS